VANIDLLSVRYQKLIFCVLDWLSLKLCIRLRTELLYGHTGTHISVIKGKWFIIYTVIHKIGTP